jgi:hypothetical protein
MDDLSEAIAGERGVRRAHSLFDVFPQGLRDDLAEPRATDVVLRQKLSELSARDLAVGIGIECFDALRELFGRDHIPLPETAPQLDG